MGSTITLGGPIVLMESTVPLADAADNAYMADVIGNKDDTVAGDSLVAICKLILASIGGGVDIDALLANVGDASGDSLISIVAKLGDDTLTVKARFDAVVALSAVPTEDAATDVNARDVIGKKTDTVAGTSIVALVKQVLAAQTSTIAVPAADAVANVDIADVIGNKADTVAGDSIIGLLKAIKAKTDTIV